MDIIDSLNWRYAVKQFDSSKKIDSKNWSILKESLRLAPSSFGLQPWKFIVVEDSKLREELKTYSWNQAQVTDCSHYVVFTTLKTIDEEYIQKYVEDIAKTRGQSVEDIADYKKMMVDVLVKNENFDVLTWTQRQSYIAMGQLMTAAAMLEIDTCPIEGISAAKYDSLLGLEDTEYRTVATVALGYRHADDKYQRAKKVRFQEETVFKTL